MHLRETQRGVKCIKKIFKNNNYINIDDGINYYDKNISENDNEIDNNNEIDDDYTHYAHQLVSESVLESLRKRLGLEM